MQKHTQVYFKYFGYGINDFVPCEVCGKKAVDIHHLDGRGKGKDVIENLQALCRDHHRKVHEGKVNPLVYKVIHKEFLEHYAAQNT